jgi:hypothetical protein
MATFTSPLRRAVGTLLALEAVLNDASSMPCCIPDATVDPSLESSLDRKSDPTFRRKLFDDIEMGQVAGRETEAESTSLVEDVCKVERQSSGPIAQAALTTRAVILNGLCDCAAQVSALGGVGWILRSYPDLLPCADAPIQRCGRTLVKELDRMRSDVNEACPPQPQRPAATIQFCRVDNAMRCEPMHVVDDDYLPHSARLSNVSNDSVPDESFLKAVNRAVMVTAAASDHDACCDKVVIVGHREGIRELARESCRQRSSKNGGARNGYADPYRIHTFYCCIAVFTVDVIVDDTSESPRLENWAFHGCHDYQSFDATCLPP